VELLVAFGDLHLFASPAHRALFHALLRAHLLAEVQDTPPACTVIVFYTVFANDLGRNTVRGFPGITARQVELLDLRHIYDGHAVRRHVNNLCRVYNHRHVCNRRHVNNRRIRDPWTIRPLIPASNEQHSGYQQQPESTTSFIDHSRLGTP